MSRFEASLDRLHRLYPKLIDLKLDRLVRLLADLGDPHLRLPPVIHVAGTNGKGSACAFMRAIAEAAGCGCMCIPRRIWSASMNGSGWPGRW